VAAVVVALVQLVSAQLTQMVETVEQACPPLLLEPL
jgi:hypothetical protein